MDLEQIKKHYQGLDNSKLESLATKEAKTLRPEVLPLLIEEIKRRNLSPAILDGMERLLKIPTNEELAEYSLLLQKQPCPVCNTKTKRLNAGMTSETVSAILFSTSRKSLYIACPDCLNRFKSNANSKTLMLGWWGLPWGPIRTIQSLMFNSRIAKTYYLETPNNIFQNYIYQNIGAIEAAKDNAIKLKNLMLQANN